MTIIHRYEIDIIYEDIHASKKILLTWEKNVLNNKKKQVYKKNKVRLKTFSEKRKEKPFA